MKPCCIHHFFIRCAVLVSGMVFCAGCFGDGSVRGVDTVMTDVNPFGWLNEAVVSFDNTDTVSLYDVSLVLRCGSDVDADSVWLALEFTSPDSVRFVERRAFPTAAPVRSASMASTVSIPYRHAVRFDRCGRYRVSLKPFRTVRGIEAAGFTFQKNEQTWEKTN